MKPSSYGPAVIVLSILAALFTVVAEWMSLPALVVAVVVCLLLTGAIFFVALMIFTTEEIDSSDQQSSLKQ